ncbi:hypothetical protein V462_11320 [Pantoea ananatis 15320]|nr:hypothetical protein V462_11320 [Pantoea ananatis 15320]
MYAWIKNQKNRKKISKYQKQTHKVIVKIHHIYPYHSNNFYNLNLELVKFI